MATWLEDTIQALENLGGKGHLWEIYDEVRRIRIEPLPIRLEETILRTILFNSSDSKSFRGSDVFQKIDQGYWGLRENTHRTTKPLEIQPDRIPSEQIEAMAFEDTIGRLNTWVEDVVQALKNLGGQAHRRQIIDEVSRIRIGTLPKRLDETVQQTIQSHSSDSKGFTGTDIFQKMGKGVWALRVNPNSAAVLWDNEPKIEQDQRIKQTSCSIPSEDQPKTWVEDIIQALKNLGGEAHLTEIVEEVRKIRKAPIPSTAIHTASTSIISYSSDSIHYKGRADIFARMGDGIWALRDFNVDFREAVGQSKRKSRKARTGKYSNQKKLGRSKESLEVIENIHNTIRQYREYTSPESDEWEGYLVDLFNVLGFTVKEHLRIPNGDGKEFPVWFISPLEIHDKYVAVLGVVKKEYTLDEFLPNVPLSIILNAHRSAQANKRNEVFYVIITDGNRLRILDYSKSRDGQICYENLNLDMVITQGFSTSFVNFYESLQSIRSYPS